MCGTKCGTRSLLLNKLKKLVIPPCDSVRTAYHDSKAPLKYKGELLS